MNVKGMIVAELNRKRVDVLAKLDSLDKLIAEFGGTGNGKVKAKRHRRTKAEMATGSEVAGADGSPQPATSSRSEKMKARWAERKAKEAAEKGEAPKTEGADLAAAAGD